MKALPAPARRREAFLWMRLWIALFAAALAPAADALLVAVPPVEAAERPILGAVTAGVRSFDEDLGLESEVAFGARLGLGINDRMSVWLDALTASPSRKVSGEPANVTALRAMIQARILAGALSPYVTVGVGGMIFNFQDSFDAAGGIATFGGGVDWRLARRTRLFAEGTVDLYRARVVSYSPTGEELSSSPRDTQSATTVAAGVALEF